MSTWTRVFAERPRGPSEGVDPGRLRRARAPLARAARFGAPTSVKEIAERTGLPQPYLEQILLAVKGAGLVRSKRGRGRRLRARPPAGRDHAGRHPRRGRRPAHHALGEHDHCEGHCILQEVWVGVSDETRQILERFTLAGAGRAHPHRPPRRRSIEPARSRARLRWRRRSRADARARLVTAHRHVAALASGRPPRGHPTPTARARRRRRRRTTSSRTIERPRPKWPFGRPSLPRLARLPEAVERVGALLGATCRAPRH